MPASASFQDGVDFLPSFLSIRPSTFTALLLLASIWIYVYTRKAIKYRHDVEFGKQSGCKPSAAKLLYRWPLALDIMKSGFRAGREKKLLAFFTKHFDQLSPTAEVKILGGIGYVTQDPENIEALLSTHFQDFELGPRSKAMRAMIGEGIFTQDGATWKHSREVLRRQFVRMQYQNLKGFREHLESLIERLNTCSGVTDLQPMFYRLTLNTTIAMILGQPVESFKHEIGDLFSKSFDKASLVTATRVRLGDMYFLYRPRGFFKACETIKRYTYQFVTDALQREAETPVESEKTSFITELHRDNQDLQLVRDQVLNVLIAGRDTTAATLSYAFHLLLRNPNVLKALGHEIDTVVGREKDITRAHIQQMPYLHNVLKETLRLYPPVPINTRFCKKTTALPVGGGPDGRSPLLVREGMPVAYSVYHMHRRKDLYSPDPLAFRPERWDGSELANIGWGYLPFNGGPRLCLGKDFGLMLASCGIVRVIQEFPNIKLAPGEVLEEPGTERQHLTLTLSNAQGCKVILN
ncbi:putative cytochrome P450 alkane hydroxylase [Hyaloscypha variabilis F]|uniref:Putative cytochrome P450 alkane hydroxylase n=1 Tax=Hyaloscypha variabilis (strain UAMH 11265 / GT02V1 / F) TaxID=1149755 RepID=A0A2J6RJR2_HYAVF|nr:putative cytochrome P450 alkane hydroxylase [Hyaloscypha variabilis F]